MPSAASYVVSIDQSMQGSSTVFFATLFYWYFSSCYLLSMAYIQNISQNNSFGRVITFTPLYYKMIIQNVILISNSDTLYQMEFADSKVGLLYPKLGK